MNLLIITYKYAPIVDPRAFRWTAIAEHWAAKGHVVDVVCAWEGGLRKEESRNGVRVHRVGGPVSQRVVEWIKGHPNGNPGGKSNISGTGKAGPGPGLLDKVLFSVQNRVNKVVEKVIWPDYAWTWYFPARREALRLLQANPCDGIVTVSVPFTGHLVGSSVKKGFPRIPWVVDIGDPFSFFKEERVNNAWLYEKLNVSMERKVLSHSDAVTVTTHQTMREYVEHFPVCSGKIRVIPPLFSISAETFGSDGSSGGDGKMRMIYVGTLYRSIRNPEYLLRLFSGLLQSELGKRLELHFYGSVHDCGEYFTPFKSILGDKIFLHGKVERETVYRAMKAASVLVNIGNTTAFQLPSKVVEYASTGKPVLNVYKIPNDSSVEFFSSYGPCLNIMDDGKNIPGTVLENVVRFIKTPPRLSQEEHREFISHYLVENISEQYEGTIKNSRGNSDYT